MNRLRLNRVRDELRGDRIQFWIDERPFERIFDQRADYLLRDGASPPCELLCELVNDVADIELRSDLQDRVDRLQEMNRAALLLCTCGEAGCWCVSCSVEIRSQSVVWKDFEGGQFMNELEFDRKQYVDEFVHFCTEGASRPLAETAGVLDAGFSHDGSDFIVITNELKYVWSLSDGSYCRASTLWEIGYQRRGEAAFQDDEIFLSGSRDPQGLWCAVVPDETTVRIVSARGDECLIELRFDAINSRWLALDMGGLFEIHGSLSYPVALPTMVGRYIRDRCPDNLRKGLLAATLTFDKHRQPSGADFAH
jgi:hypothetical protein